MRSQSLLSEIADQLMTPDFAARLTQAKFLSAEAELKGALLPIDDIAEMLDLPPTVVEVLLAWNVANANAGHIMDMMRAGREAEKRGVRH